MIWGQSANRTQIIPIEFSITPRPSVEIEHREVRIGVKSTPLDTSLTSETEFPGLRLAHPDWFELNRMSIFRWLIILCMTWPIRCPVPMPIVIQVMVFYWELANSRNLAYLFAKNSRDGLSLRPLGRIICVSWSP